MSTYPTYSLEVHTDKGWRQVEGTEASSRPHHYDTLRAEFDKLVNGALPFKAHFVPEFGYRIAQDGRDGDVWMAHPQGESR